METLVIPSDRIYHPGSAYVHIPFCRRRCFYCDFPIAVAGDRARGETSPRIQAYVDTLCREIQATPVLGRSLETVFFGGGTPSLLSVPQVEQILTTLADRFGIADGAEVSMEMDPGTFTLDALRALTALGVNRISLGVQSFQDAQLEACGRTHRVADSYRAIGDLRTAGLSNWSLDLISGLPHQTMADWEAGLDMAIAFNPTHISVYDLTVEPGTVFDRRYIAGQFPLPTDEATSEMYRCAQARLTDAGYEHYEISNYARPGYQCRHNRVYWENRPCYGFGMGAASYTQQQRFHRPRTTHDYETWVEAYCDRGGQLDCDPATASDQWLDRLMMGLRLAEGLRLDDLVQEFGPAPVDRLQACLDAYVQKGWVIRQRQPFPVLKLADPDGFLFSNVILVSLFETFDDP